MSKLDFRHLFDASPNAYLVLDERLHIAGANRAYLDSVRRDLADLVDRRVWDVFPADDGTVRQTVASVERVIRTKQPDTIVLSWPAPSCAAVDDDGFMARCRGFVHTPVFDAEGDVAFVLQHPTGVVAREHPLEHPLEHPHEHPLGTRTDDRSAAAHASNSTHGRSVDCTSEARGSDVVLEGERSRLEDVFVQAPGFMALLHGREHRFESASPGFMRLFGDRPVLGRSVAEALPDAVAQGYLALLDRVFDSGEPHVARSTRYVLPASPGQAARDLYLDLVYQPVRDAGGRVTGIFVEGADVSDIRASEAALRASEVRNRQILDSAIDYAIIATDLDGRVTRWNEGARRILGWTEEEMLGRSTARFFTPEDVASNRMDIEMRVALEKGRSNDERWNQRNGGERFWALGEMTVLRDEAGEAKGFVKVLRDRTGQHQAERAREAAIRDLETERTLLQTVLRSAPIGILVAEAPSGRVLEQNARTGAIFDHGGVRCETVGDLGRWPLLHPDDRLLEIARHPLVRAITLGETTQAEEYRYVRGDEETRWVQLTAAPITDMAKRITGGVMLVEDIEPRKRAEAALRDNRQRLAALVSASTEVLYSMSADWSEMRQLTGSGFLADTRTANASWLIDYIPAEEHARVQAAIGQAIHTKSVFRLEHRVYRADRTLGWTVSSAVPLLDAGGTVTEWFGAASDVTDRRDAAEAMSRSNEDLEQQVVERTTERNRLWDFSPDLLLIIDFHGMFHRVNPAWTTLLGYAADELIGHHVNEFVLPEDHTETTHAYREAATGGLPRIQNRYRHKDGSTRWISWVAAPQGELAYATGRDITAEKAALEALAHTQDALRQSQKMEAVGQLTGGLAHDFNNLLTGIIGSLELLQTRIAQGRTADVDRYVHAAQGSARRAAALTHRLLAFSRRQTLAPKPTDVRQLVHGMEELVRRTVGPEIAVTTVMPGTLWSTLVDPGQLENALLNLCINARDAMPHGGAIVIETVNCRLDARSARVYDMTPGEYLLLCVSDTGTGMSPEVIAKAFDPFFTTKPIGMGTGLGLSMIYGFVQQSGGQVRIYSEVGKGTTVRLYLPRHLGEAEHADVPAELADAPRAGVGETVLVVDDEPTIRMLVVAVLEDLGYTAIEAADGVAGLAILQSDARIDLVVSDVGLPGGMNGRQMADAARVGRPELTVLFITGYAESAVFSHGHFNHGMHVLTKPFAMEVLASRIKALINDT
ncbi:MAG: PAS domain S-box protein [Janthinobacterium lividum]